MKTVVIVLILQLTVLFSMNALITIPVVVHVVYATSEQNISNEQVVSQIEALNRDFRKQNVDLENIDLNFKHLSADVEVEFQLAGTDPLGNITTGITRTATSHGVFGNSDIHFSVKGGTDNWDVTQYLNIWVCDLTPSVLGWSSSPENIDLKDGVVIDYTNFGQIGVTTNYKLGRTAVHEVGHWLGLLHPEGLGGCGSDDGIADTPNQEFSYTTCNINRNDCGGTDILQNFMQSGNDECLLFFTQGQADKMNTILANERKLLVENADHVLPNELLGVSEKQTIVYPNPVLENEIKIHLIEGKSYQVRLQSLDGLLLYNQFILGGETIEIGELPHGIYTLIVTSNKKSSVEKIEII